MVKDSQKFAQTGGWGFEVFKGDTQSASLAAEARTECFTCHKKRPELVFSEFRK